MFYCYFYRVLNCCQKNPVKRFFFFELLFLFINLFFMIVKFCTYQFIEPHKFLNVGPRKYIGFPSKKKKVGVLGTNIWKICVLRAEILAKTRLKMQNFLKI